MDNQKDFLPIANEGEALVTTPSSIVQSNEAININENVEEKESKANTEIVRTEDNNINKQHIQNKANEKTEVEENIADKAEEKTTEEIEEPLENNAQINDDINNENEQANEQENIGENNESETLNQDSFVSGFDESTLSENVIEDAGENINEESSTVSVDEDGTFVSSEKTFVVDNIDDSQLLADEVGISGIYDTYGREILEPVFENQLRLSKNSIKLAYSRLKNTLLNYRDVKQRYSNGFELFKKSNKILCRMEIGEDCLNLYFALNFDELNSESFVFHSAKGQYKQTPTRVTILKGDEKSGEVYLTAISFVEKVMAENGIERNKTYVPTAYAERYPFNPNAVLKGREEIPPMPEQLEDMEYDYIEGELSKNIIEELMGESFKLDDKHGKDKLNALRQQASTIKGAVAITEPIIYFFDSALTRENVNAYLNIQQVLQDKFLGKMLPQQYFAVAESSGRIEQLNFLAVKEAVTCCDENPKYNFCVKISCRMLTKGSAFERLLKYSKTENNNLIMAFDCALLEVLGLEGMQAIEKLKENGIKIMLDNTESAGLKVLTEYVLDYLRFDARYYKEENLRTTAHLDMLTSYCKVQGILTASVNVDSNKEAKYLMMHGVDIIQGFVIEEPKRTIAGAVKEVRKLASVSV